MKEFNEKDYQIELRMWNNLRSPGMKMIRVKNRQLDCNHISGKLNEKDRPINLWTFKDETFVLIEEKIFIK